MATPQVGGAFSIIPSPELLSPPDTNVETEDSSSQRWPCLLALNSPTLPCPALWGEGMVPAASCLPGLSKPGTRLTQTPHPLAGGAGFPKEAGQACWLVLRSGLDAAQTLLQG